MMDKALQLSQHQTQMAVEVSRAMTAGLSALFEASTGFAKANVERQTAFVIAMMAAKSPEAFAQLQRNYLNHSLQSAGEMATHLATTLAAAAKPFEVVTSPAGPAKSAT